MEIDGALIGAFFDGFGEAFIDAFADEAVHETARKISDVGAGSRARRRTGD